MRKFILVLVLAAVGGVSVAGQAAASGRCPSNAAKASYSIWQAGELRSGVVATAAHSCGRSLRCMGGATNWGFKRQCNWI